MTAAAPEKKHANPFEDMMASALDDGSAKAAAEGSRRPHRPWTR